MTVETDDNPTAGEKSRRVETDPHSKRGRSDKTRSFFKQNFGQLLDAHRKTQAQVVREVNEQRKAKDPKSKELNSFELSRYARGTMTPAPETVADIAAVFGKSIDDLVPGYGAIDDPLAFVFTVRELEDGRFFINISGAFDAEKKAKITIAMA